MTALILAGAAAAVVFGLALLLTLVARQGRPGRVLADFLARAPMLDVVLAVFSWVPWVVGGVVAGWGGLGAVVAGQAVGLIAWGRVHELIYREAARGPRIVKTLNGFVGRVRNHGALWVTVVVFPLFWMIRVAQILLYPLLVMFLRFPRYRAGEWINVSRQKFEGLVGHDLAWCLYCDWMTGVYSLGAEMLRNVESFWCPIRFYDGRKCEHCRVDFPDLDGGWVAADGTMTDVTETLEQHYGDGRREWYGHPARLTVEGSEPR